MAHGREVTRGQLVQLVLALADEPHPWFWHVSTSTRKLFDATLRQIMDEEPPVDIVAPER